MIYNAEYLPRIDDLDRFGALSLKAILDIIEDAGDRHSAAVEKSVFEKSLEGYTWILTEWNVKIIRRPGSGERLRVSTWTHGKYPALLISREYRMQSESGEDLVLASARMGLMDVSSGRLVRITEDYMSVYEPEDFSVLEPPSPPRLREPKQFDRVTTVPLRRSDMDFNGHTHNTKYIIIASEAIPEELEREASYIRIAYHNPLRGGSARVTCSLDESGATLGIYDENGTFCAAASVKR